MDSFCVQLLIKRRGDTACFCAVQWALRGAGSEALAMLTLLRVTGRERCWWKTLRCDVFRPRTSGRNVWKVQRISASYAAPLVRGADGAPSTTLLRGTLLHDLVNSGSHHKLHMT